MTEAALLGDLSKWLAATSLSHTIQTTSWIIPTVQTIHILCVAVLFSSAVLVDLRIWRLTQRDVPLSDVGRRFLPLIWPVVIVLLLTGSLSLVLTGLLQWSLTSAPGFWERDIARRIVGRVAALASILAWSGIIFAGRFIAYTQT
jgi:hypothetical protein